MKLKKWLKGSDYHISKFDSDYSSVITNRSINEIKRKRMVKFIVSLAFLCLLSFTIIFTLIKVL